MQNPPARYFLKSENVLGKFRHKKKNGDCNETEGLAWRVGNRESLRLSSREETGKKWRGGEKAGAGCLGLV